jgi:hypothetical protein
MTFSDLWEANLPRTKVRKLGRDFQKVIAYVVALSSAIDGETTCSYTWHTWHSLRGVAGHRLEVIVTPRSW